MTVDRSTIRKQFATRLDTRLSSIVEKVFPYQAADLKGISPVVIVTGAGSDRSSFVTSSQSNIKIEVHTFVIYALRPVVSTRPATAGTSAVIYLNDTTPFEAALPIYVSDDNNGEITEVISVTPSTNIVADLTKSYTNPRVSVWTEEQSEDLLDLIEATIADEIRVANDDNIWLSISNDGESIVDVVDLGGDAYRHETIPVRISVLDF